MILVVKFNTCRLYLDFILDSSTRRRCTFLQRQVLLLTVRTIDLVHLFPGLALSTCPGPSDSTFYGDIVVTIVPHSVLK
jgi:hypothetical protein